MPRTAHAQAGRPDGDALGEEPPEAVAIEKPLPPDTGEPKPVPVEADNVMTAAEVTGAPVPGQESGRIDEQPEDSTMRQVGRVALFVPRVLFGIVFAPVRGGVYLVDRYNLDERYRQIFYTDGGELGLLPTLWYDSDQGLQAGARLKWTPTDDTKLALFAGGGRRSSQLAFEASTRVEDRVELGLHAELWNRPRAAFYGIGNGDEVSGLPPEAAPINPLVNDTAVETRFDKGLGRVSAAADVEIVDDVFARGVGMFADVEVNDPAEDERSPDVVYDPDALLGSDGYRVGYGELELRWDTRRGASLWEPRSLNTGGSLVSGFVGRSAIDGDNMLETASGYWRYGADLHHFVQIARGPQVIAMRLYGEGVSAQRDEIPFTELPMLGGSNLLRGYAFERFRDRVALQGSLEYQWDLSRYVFASLFTDVGRVYPSIEDITLAGMRWGFGVALEAYSRNSFQARVSLASSIDGGFFVRLHLDPIFGTPHREARR